MAMVNDTSDDESLSDDWQLTVIDSWLTCWVVCVQVLRDAQVMIERMEHRGGWSCDNDTGDGAGVLTGIPHELYATVLR